MAGCADLAAIPQTPPPTFHRPVIPNQARYDQKWHSFWFDGDNGEGQCLQVEHPSPRTLPYARPEFVRIPVGNFQFRMHFVLRVARAILFGMELAHG
jgi:hypothetical protein